MPAYFIAQGNGPATLFVGTDNELEILVGEDEPWTWNSRLGIVTKPGSDGKPVLIGAKGNVTATIPVGSSISSDGVTFEYNFLYY